MLVPAVKYILSGLTVLGIAITLFYLASRPFRKTKFIKKVESYFAEHAITASLIVAIIATIGSLFFSEIAGYDPCKLCWYQRIAMYPQVVILGMALIKKLNPRPFILPLSVIGAPIAAYHYGLQIYAKLTPGFADTCAAAGGISCAAAPNMTFGFVTIPLMALVAFILIIIFSTRK